jgi:cytidyltransferase-like protein
MEWRFYCVEYKAMKKALKKCRMNTDNDSVSRHEHDENDDINENLKEFFHLYDDSIRKLVHFYHDREKWALSYFDTLEERLEVLKNSHDSVEADNDEKLEVISTASSSSSLPSGSEDEDASQDPQDDYCVGVVEAVSDYIDNRNDKDSVSEYENETQTESNTYSSPHGVDELRNGKCAIRKVSTTQTLITASSSSSTFEENNNRMFSWLKEQYRAMGKSDHFHNYIYAKKSFTTFDREIDLLLEFLHMNLTALSKILKKLDKHYNSNYRSVKLNLLKQQHPFLFASDVPISSSTFINSTVGHKLNRLKQSISHMIQQTNSMKPNLPQGWEDRKVYTIGCFDLFHRGHQNVLNSLREFGYFIVAGIHDDESYFKLKNKYTIDNLETRMKNVKPFVDQLFVIPSTNPDLYLQSMVSEQDIMTGSCCYARGDDMLNFPGREWVESVMPVHFVPRTESCSSTLIRTIYHSEDKELGQKAAFAKTRYDGKPVDEDGNLLKL